MLIIKTFSGRQGFYDSAISCIKKAKKDIHVTYFYPLSPANIPEGRKYFGLLEKILKENPDIEFTRVVSVENEEKLGWVRETIQRYKDNPKRKVIWVKSQDIYSRPYNINLVLVDKENMVLGIPDLKNDVLGLYIENKEIGEYFETYFKGLKSSSAEVLDKLQKLKDIATISLEIPEEMADINRIYLSSLQKLISDINLEYAVLPEAQYQTEHWLKQPNDYFRIVKNKGETIGFIQAKIRNKSFVWLSAIYVKPEYQKKRHAQKLMKDLLDFVRAKGIKNIALTTYSFNPISLTLFNSFDFRFQQFVPLLDISNMSSPYVKSKEIGLKEFISLDKKYVGFNREGDLKLSVKRKGSLMIQVSDKSYAMISSNGLIGPAGAPSQEDFLNLIFASRNKGGKYLRVPNSEIVSLLVQKGAYVVAPLVLMVHGKFKFPEFYIPHGTHG